MIRDAAAFQSVVRGGALEQRGMPSWDDLLTEQQVDQIRAHLVSQQRAAWEQQGAGQPAAPATSAGHL
jgi:hypothetical protein